MGILRFTGNAHFQPRRVCQVNNVRLKSNAALPIRIAAGALEVVARFRLHDAGVALRPDRLKAGVAVALGKNSSW